MSRARDLSKLGNPGVFSVSADNNVGVNSTAPVEKLNVVGVVSATAFYGDGSGLENLKSAGLGTAIIRDSEYGGEQIYYTNKQLNITGNLTVDAPDSAEVAYTQYQEIVVDSGADFIVGDGDDFIPDILGIGTEVQQPGLLAGGGGRVRADNFSDKSGTGAPTFSSGVVVTGVVTATKFVGSGEGLIGVASTDNIITGTAATFTGGITANEINVTGNISIGGTLTYEDVTNVDSVGLITARSGIEVAGIITAKAGAALTYYGDGSGLTFAPKVIAYDPAALSTGISTTTNITFTFDQNIQFAGTGTIEVRETSNSGTIATSFAISGGVAPTGLSIVNNQLIINPTEPLSLNTVHYVVLPSAGIANAQGSYYAGSNVYNFQTLTASENFSIEGGDYSFDVNTGTGPTGWHRYHIFTTSGILTVTGSSSNATELTGFMVAGGGAGGSQAPANSAYGGGGGGGGLLTFTGPSLALGTGNYNITIGAGGTMSTGPSPLECNTGGENTTITNSSSTALLTAYGGGAGGTIGFPVRPPSSPSYPGPSINGEPGGSGGGNTWQQLAGDGINGQGYPGGPDLGTTNYGGAGGGAGGAGGSFNSSLNGAMGGNGSPQPAFNDTILAPRVPGIPSSVWPSIGPTGLYGGGGGGGNGGPTPNGGPGGGGNSWAHPGGQHSGMQNTGGGGGSGGGFPYNVDGGPGVLMLRYTVPDPGA